MVDVSRGHKDMIINLFGNVKFNLAQNVLTCGLLPSLAHLALIRVAVSFWEQDIRINISSHDSYIVKLKSLLDNIKVSVNMNVVEKNVQEKIAHLIVPPPYTLALQREILSLGKELCSFLYAQKLHFKSLCLQNIYLRNICFTQQGTVNILKTMERIVDYSDLSLREKYVIACNSCLEKKIIELIGELPTDIVNDFRSDEDKLVLFWTLCIKGEEYRFPKVTNGAATNEYLLNWAISYGNEVAVQYIWENLADKTMKKEVVHYIQMAMGQLDYNILLYLYTQINGDQVEEILMIPINGILRTLNYFSNRCKGFVSITQYLIDFIHQNGVGDSFDAITYCWFAKLIDKEQYVNIWNVVGKHFGSNFETKFVELAENFDLETILAVNNDMLTIKMVLGMGSERSKRQYMYNVTGIGLGFGLITRGKLDLFNALMNEVFSSREDITAFKTEFFSQTLIDISYQFIISNQYDLLDKIYVYFDAETDKPGLPLYNDADIISRILKCNGMEEDKKLIMIDEFLEWSCSECKDEVQYFKAYLFSVDKLVLCSKDQFFERIKVLIRKEEWVLVKNYWIWIFYIDKDRISTPTKKVKRVVQICYLSSLDECGDMIKKFVTNCFALEEIDVIRQKLAASEELVSVITDLLQLGKYVEMHDLLDWCFVSDIDKINTFIRRHCYRFEGVEDSIRKDINDLYTILEDSFSEFVPFVQYIMSSEDGFSKPNYLIQSVKPFEELSRSRFSVFIPFAKSIKLLKEDLANFITEKKLLLQNLKRSCERIRNKKRLLKMYEEKTRKNRVDFRRKIR